MSKSKRDTALGPVDYRVDTAMRRIAEFSFDDDWDSADVSRLSDDAMIVVGELEKMRGRAAPKERRCVCGALSKMFTADMEHCTECLRRWYV